MKVNNASYAFELIRLLGVFNYFPLNVFNAFEIN